jgi:hypothetical protein
MFAVGFVPRLSYEAPSGMIAEIFCLQDEEEKNMTHGHDMQEKRNDRGQFAA